MHQAAKRNQRGVRYGFRHIRTKLLVSYVLILILPFIFLSYGFLHVLGGVYAAQKEKDAIASVQVLSENMRYTLGGVSDVLADFCSDMEVWSYLCHDYRYPDSSIAGYYGVIRHKLDNYMVLHPEILSTTVYTFNSSIVTNESDMQRLARGSWAEHLVEKLDGNSDVWMLYNVQDGGDQGLYAARIMRPYGKTVGLFCLRLKEESLLRLLGAEELDGSLSVVDGKGNIVLSTSPALMGRPLAETPIVVGERFELDGEIQQAYAVDFPVRYSPESWQMIQTLNTRDIQLVGRTNMTFLAMLGTLMLVMMAVLAIFFSHSLTTRLSAIRQGMAGVEEGDFSVRVPVKGRDEVASLAGMLNHMIARLDALVTENARIRMQKRELELAQREAQLNALQSQINPHFLFNSLEAILYGIRTNPRETAGVVQMLARNLRRLASWEHETTFLREELLYIDEYLQIQKFRYGELLRYHVDVEESLMDMQIPNLLLQPLVENAVAHGIAMKPGGGTVTVLGLREGEDIVLTVEDDGAGMSEVSQEELRQSLSRPVGQAGACIGLKNVYDRIRLYYDGRAQFVWESREDEYTRMTLILREVNDHACDDCG